MQSIGQNLSNLRRFRVGFQNGLDPLENPGGGFLNFAALSRPELEPWELGSLERWMKVGAEKVVKCAIVEEQIRLPNTKGNIAQKSCSAHRPLLKILSKLSFLKTLFYFQVSLETSECFKDADDVPEFRSRHDIYNSFDHQGGGMSSNKTFLSKIFSITFMKRNRKSVNFMSGRYLEIEPPEANKIERLKEKVGCYLVGNANHGFFLMFRTYLRHKVYFCFISKFYKAN